MLNRLIVAAGLTVIGAVGLSGRAAAAPLLEYDPGEIGVMGAQRPFRDASGCVEAHPCQIDIFGAFRLGTDGAKDTVALHVVHGSFQRPILLFQRTAGGAQGPIWMATHRSRNEQVLNFDTLLEDAGAEPPLLFVYGFNLQYQLQNGDLLYAEIREGARSGEGVEGLGGRGEIQRFYFRYWNRGIQARLGVTTLVPVKPGASNAAVSERIEGSLLNVAVSLMLYRNLQPDGEYTFLRRAFNGVQPTLLVGLMSRMKLVGTGSDAAAPPRVMMEPDLLLGLGLTGLRCVTIGAAATVIQSDRGVFPFVGVHLDELLTVLREVVVSPTRQWNNYRWAEEAASGPAPAGPQGPPQ